MIPWRERFARREPCFDDDAGLGFPAGTIRQLSLMTNMATDDDRQYPWLPGVRQSYLHFEAVLAVAEREMGIQPKSGSSGLTVDWLPTPDLSGAASESVVQSLRANHVAIFPEAYRPQDCARLLEVARTYPMKEDSDITGSLAANAGVTVAFISPDQDNLLVLALHALALALQNYFGPTGTLPMGWAPRLWELQAYPAGCPAMERHRDDQTWINLIALVTLSGSAGLTIWGSTGLEHTHVVHPGTLVLLPAPGFSGLDLRPLHKVGSMIEERWVASLRQEK